MYKVFSNGVLEGEYANEADARAKATELCNNGAANVGIDVSEVEQPQ